MPDVTVIGTLAGAALLGYKTETWVFRTGVQPSVAEFTVSATDAAGLKKRVGPVVLTLKGAGSALTVKNLYILKITAADNPFLRKVVVADRRCWWSYPHVRRAYNMRRNVGTFRTTDPSIPVVSAPVPPRVIYVPFSLRNPDNPNPAEAKWYAKEAVEDIIQEACESEMESFGTEGAASQTPQFSLATLGALSNLDLESIQINDAGDAAVNRILSYIPEGAVTVDENGIIQVWSKADGRETGVVQSLKYPMVGSGTVQFTSNAPVRPIYVDVLFSIKAEVRFIFTEPASYVGESVVEDEDARVMDNVAAIPDFELLVDGATLVQGTYLTLSELLRAYNADLPSGINKLDYEQLRRAMVPYKDFWAPFLLLGQFSRNVNWATRVACIRRNWRMTYRINRKWMDRALSIHAERTAILNVATGTYARSPVYMNYTVIPGQRHYFASRYRGTGGNPSLAFCYPVPAYPPNGNIDPDTLASPAIVVIEDADQGIIHFDFKLDPFGEFEKVLPGFVEVRGQPANGNNVPLYPGPTADYTRKALPIAFNGVSSKDPNAICQFRSGHKASTIISLVPGYPNDERQFFKVRMYPSDISDLLPERGKAGLAEAFGPPMEVYIEPSIEMARVQWVDSRSQDIEKLFGYLEGSPNLKGLVTNEFSTGAHGGGLKIIAKAAAARIYAALADRYEGSMDVDFAPGIKPLGWLSEVAHSVDPLGVMRTAIVLPGQIPQLNILSFMDSGTRALILKLATPGKE